MRPPTGRVLAWTLSALAGLCVLTGCGPREFEPYAIAVGKVIVEGSDPAEPVAGADVVLAGVRATPEMRGEAVGTGLAAGTADDGSFVINPIPLTRLDVFISVSRDGYRTFDTDLNLQKSGDLTIELTVVEDELQAGTINGSTVDFETGEPLAQIEVKAIVESGGLVVDEQKAHTALDGLFQISGIPVGEAVIQASIEGYIPARETVLVLPSQASNRFVELQLAPGTLRVTLAGRVFDIETQEPVEGAIIGTDESTDTTVSSADGTFELPGVLVGDRIINASRPGYDPLFLTIVVLAENAPLELGMAPASDDPPVPVFTIGGTITVQSTTDASGVSVVLVNSGGDVVGRLTTESNGRYGFFVPAGTYTVRATLPGFGAQEATVSILPGESRDGVDFTLVP